MIVLSISALLANLGVVFCARATLRFYEEHRALREQFLQHQAECKDRVPHAHSQNDSTQGASS